LSIIWQIVAIAVAIVIIVVGLILLVPFEISASGAVSLSATDVNLKVSWLGVTLYRVKPGIGEEPEKRKRKISLSKISRIASLSWNSIPAFEILIRSFKKAVHISRLSANLVFGTGDPADTALVTGCLWSLSWLLRGAFPNVRLSVRPDMEKAVLDGSVNALARVRLLFVVVGFLRAYSKRPFRQFVGEIRSMR
jgi:hypothetical protein